MMTTSVKENINATKPSRKYWTCIIRAAGKIHCLWVRSASLQSAWDGAVEEARELYPDESQADDVIIDVQGIPAAFIEEMFFYGVDGRTGRIGADYDELDDHTIG